MRHPKKAIITLIDEKGVVIRTQFMAGEDFFMTVEPEMCKVLSKALDIRAGGRNPVVITDRDFEHLHEVDKKFNETRYEYSKLKIRFMQENLLKFEGGTPIDWACFYITRFLNDYLKEHNVKDSDSITEKEIHTIAFAHALEDKLLDYIHKLEEFNND